jgi:hypothetical protein
MSRTVVPFSGYGSQGLQVFTPSRIETVGAGNSLTTTQTATEPRVIAVRVAANTNYQINGTGDVGVLPAGRWTGVANTTVSLLFPAGATVEVM